MFSQQNSRPTLSAAAMLLQEIEVQKEIGFPESNLVSNVHYQIHSLPYNKKKQTTHKKVFYKELSARHGGWREVSKHSLQKATV